MSLCNLGQLKICDSEGNYVKRVVIIIIINRTCMLIDVAISGDRNVIKKKPRQF